MVFLPSPTKTVPQLLPPTPHATLLNSLSSPLPGHQEGRHVAFSLPKPHPCDPVTLPPVQPPGEQNLPKSTGNSICLRTQSGRETRSPALLGVGSGVACTSPNPAPICTHVALCSVCTGDPPLRPRRPGLRLPPGSPPFVLCVKEGTAREEGPTDHQAIPTHPQPVPC